MARKASHLRKTCLCCQHPSRHQIEMLRVSGISLDALARRFEISRDSIFRHMKSHVSDDVRAGYLGNQSVEEMAARAAKENVSLLDYFGILRSTLMQKMLHAAAMNDKGALAALSGRVIEVLKEIGKLTGEMSRIGSITTNTTILVNSPIFLALETMLIDRLAAYPQALAAVVEGLRTLDSASPDIAAHGAPLLTLEAPNVSR